MYSMISSQISGARNSFCVINRRNHFLHKFSEVLSSRPFHIARLDRTIFNREHIFFHTVCDFSRTIRLFLVCIVKTGWSSRTGVMVIRVYCLTDMSSSEDKQVGYATFSSRNLSTHVCDLMSTGSPRNPSAVHRPFHPSMLSRINS